MGRATGPTDNSPEAVLSLVREGMRQQQDIGKTPNLNVHIQSTTAWKSILFLGNYITDRSIQILFSSSQEPFCLLDNASAARELRHFNLTHEQVAPQLPQLEFWPTQKVIG